MKNTPAVSIVLPTHNRCDVLGRAIRSLLAQTFTDFELIVVDDASADDVAAVVDAFDDERLVYQRLDSNSGAAAARNAGVQIATAPLIAFQDSDDEWLVVKLEKQLAAMREMQADLICCGYFVLPSQGMPWTQGADRRMQAGDWSADNIYDFRFITPTWLISRSAFEQLGGFDESMPNLEDWEFAFRLYKQGLRMTVLDELLVIKHGGNDSLNWASNERIKSLQAILDRHADIWEQQPRHLAMLYDELGRWQLRAGSMRERRRNLFRAVQLDARQLKRWMHLLAGMGGSRVYSRLSKGKA